MMKKTFYEAPESELIVVRFEEAFLQGTGPKMTTKSDNRPEYVFDDLDDLDD